VTLSERSVKAISSALAIVSLVSAALAETPATTKIADPEDGSVAAGAYTNDYFGLSYPLPPGWAEGLKGPPPSYTAYYVLASLESSAPGQPSLLIVAQDLFFGARPLLTAKQAAGELRNAEAQVPQMTIDREPAETRIAGHSFMRVDYSAGGLYRAWFATELRCHLVIFNFTTTDAAALETAVHSLDKMSLPSDAPANGEAASAVPACIHDYATPENMVHRVEPAQIGPRFLKIPVRIIIGADGDVKHIHVISAFPEQKTAIETALAQWRFKPYEVQGRPAEVETGLIFEFKPESNN
jgi:Gram-negative bacterial TonB protein C-terminal